jgi:hypothetical protein
MGRDLYENSTESTIFANTGLNQYNYITTSGYLYYECTVELVRVPSQFKLWPIVVFAACNEITRLSKPLQSRFRRLHLPRYTEEQFLEVSAKVLPKLKIAHVIGKAVWEQRGDIRDVISIGKLVRKNDGPKEVEQILSTMTKYGRNSKQW